MNLTYSLTQLLYTASAMRTNFAILSLLYAPLAYFIICYYFVYSDITYVKNVYAFTTGSSNKSMSSASNTRQNGNAIDPVALDAIKSKYQQFAHTLGNPSSDIQVIGSDKAYFQKFDNGWIFWLPSLGAHEVHGGIADKWDEFGREHGILGFPVSDEHDVSGGRQSDFQHGSLYWITDKNEVTVILHSKFSNSNNTTSAAAINTGQLPSINRSSITVNTTNPTAVTSTNYGDLGQAYGQGFDRRKDIEMQLHDPKNIMPGKAVLLIYSDGSWSGSVLDTSSSSATQEGLGDKRIEFECSSGGTYSMFFQNQGSNGYLLLAILQNGKPLNAKSTTAEYGVVSVAGQCD